VAAENSQMMANLIMRFAGIAVLTLLPALNSFVIAQDTLLMMHRQWSGDVVWVYTNSDTSLVGFYTSGHRESVRKYSKYGINGPYERYYENGKLMWLKHLTGDREDGICTFYNDNGVKVAELRYNKGIVTDTIFLAADEAVLIGKATYFSHVVGGVVRQEQLTPEPVRQDYPYMNFPMLLVKIKDARSIPVLAEKFETDHNGDFLLCLKNGTYGFFPAGYDMKKLQPGAFCPPPEASGSTESSWNMTAPLMVEAPALIFFNLHFTSIGYAP
jgi:hypothetical protein